MTTTADTRTWIQALQPVSVDVANALIEQGIELDQLDTFEPNDINVMCSAARKPGGTINDPTALVNVYGGPVRQVQNPGVTVPAILQLKLKVAVTAAQFYNDVGRPVTPLIMNWTRIMKFRAYNRAIEEWEDAESLPVYSSDSDTIKFLELVREHLRSKLGIRKIPLSYVIRKDVAVPPIGVIKEDFPYSDNVTSFHDDLIKRALHDHPNYADDNATVLDILVACFKGTMHMSDLKPFQRTRDGRGALLALELHNMGTSKYDTIVSKAENTVLNTKWNGRNSRFTLARHIAAHRNAQNEMMQCQDAIGYQAPNEHTRVGRLLHSIISSDLRVVSAKTTILADSVKRKNFEDAADFLLLAAPVTRGDDNRGTDHNISALEEYDGFNEVEVGKTGVEFRYYKGKEFAQLSDEQREELIAHREKFGNLKKRGKRKGEPGNDPSNNKKKKHEARIAALETTNKDLADQVKDLIATIASQGTLPTPSTLPPTQSPAISNRSNRNLTRVPRPPTQNA